MKSIDLAMRSFSSGMLVSVLVKVGRSAPASRPHALAAWLVASRTWRTRGYMSGVSRVFNRTAGSIFFVSAWAAALSNTADKLVRNCTKMGADALYREMVIALGPSGHSGGGTEGGKLGNTVPQRKRVAGNSIA